VLDDFLGASDNEDDDKDNYEEGLRAADKHQLGKNVRGGRTDCEVVTCDLKVEGTATKQIEDFRPYAVLHLAGEWRPDHLASDPTAARKLNVDVTGEVAAACQRHGVAWMLFISSNGVFDGDSGPYGEDDLASPISSFGWQKLHAEQLTMVACPRAAVLRLPVLYGPCDSAMDSAVTSLHSDLVNGVREVDAWQRCYPTWTPEVAKIIVKMLGLHAEGKGSDLRGIFHWQGAECLTWHQMLAQVAKLTSICDASRLVGVSAAPDVALPKDAKLKTSRLEALLGPWIPASRISFCDGLEMCLNQLSSDPLDANRQQDASAAVSSFSPPSCCQQSSSPAVAAAVVQSPSLEQSSPPSSSSSSAALAESEKRRIQEQEQPKLLGKLRESSSLVWPSSSCDRWAFDPDAFQPDSKAAREAPLKPSEAAFPTARVMSSTNTLSSDCPTHSACWRLKFESEKLPRRTAVFGSQGQSQGQSQSHGWRQSLSQSQSEHPPKEGGASPLTRAETLQSKPEPSTRPEPPNKSETGATSFSSSPEHERFEEELKRRGAALQELFWQELERTRHRLKEAGPSDPLTLPRHGACNLQQRGPELRHAQTGSRNSSRGPLPKESVDWRSSCDPQRGLAAFGTPRHWGHSRVGECAS